MATAGLVNDPLTQIAFSIYENKGVFALLLGSGLSRAAEVPTGWEVTLDLVRRVAVAQGVDEQADWAAWYRDQTGTEPNYSTVLEEIALSAEERRSILHRYIEPNEEDKEHGRKVPTKAHYAIADLVRAGYIRVIITTNFDRLMENALRERGIEPCIVSAVDGLRGAEPLTHTACYILKLHGDYKDARILNTETELTRYPPEYDALLDRIFDEHGMIVSGWSGEWDLALRAAFLRAPSRRYTTFWTVRGIPGSGAQQLIEHRRARVITITDADTFFTSLEQRVATLDQSKTQNPLSIELLVASAKRLSTKSEHRIQLDDLVTQETDRLFDRLQSSDFDIPGGRDLQMFRDRIRLYETASEGLAGVAGVLGRWGDGSEVSMMTDVIQGLYTDARKISSGGASQYLNIRSYPAVLMLTSYGIGLTLAQRWQALHRLFVTPLAIPYAEPKRVVDELFLWNWKGAERDLWRQVEGDQGRPTPFSDHLHALFSIWRKRFAGLSPNFDLLFERYEMLGSLAHLEAAEKQCLQNVIADAENHIHMSVGRSTWNAPVTNRLFDEFKTQDFRIALLQAGFARGDSDFIDLFLVNFTRNAKLVRYS